MPLSHHRLIPQVNAVSAVYVATDNGAFTVDSPPVSAGDALQSWLDTARSYPLAQATTGDQPAISDTAAPGLLVPEFGATDNLTAVAVPGVQIMAWMVVGRVTSMQTGGRTVASRSTKA